MLLLSASSTRLVPRLSYPLNRYPKLLDLFEKRFKFKRLNSMGANNNLETSKSSWQLPDALTPFDLYGWTRNNKRSNDENYMDIVLLITRSSYKKGGSMGCILVKDHTAKTDEEFYNAIIAASTNKSLFKPNDSDIHAEVSTIGQCAEKGVSTRNGTIYITMPPCKKCFGAIVSAGIKRIVSNKSCGEEMQKIAQSHGIQLVNMFSFIEGQKLRLNELIDISKEERTRIQEES